VFAKDDVIQVCAKTDDVDQLLNRLLKYNTLCQVISPMSARNEMLQRIERLLKISELGVVTALDAKVI
jgi:predicted DNA-binding transcriptional regulator YafY